MKVPGRAQRFVFTSPARLLVHLFQFLLQGTAKYLFSPLSLAVCVSLIASLALSFTLPGELSRYVAEKGSIALNGVSTPLLLFLAAVPASVALGAVICIGEVSVGVMGASPPLPGSAKGFRSLAVKPGVSALATFWAITCWRSAR